MSKLEHRGINDYRLKDTRNRREAVFAKHWREMNRLNPKLLSSLLGREATQDDATVAATVIQFLGEKTGREFLDQCLQKCTGIIKV